MLNVGRALRACANGGENSLFYMRNTLRNEYHNLLRGVSLVSHNQLNTHDYYGSVYQEENEDLINAAKLMQMTILGSPSVYFGEETNFSGRAFDSEEGMAEGFSSFNWDESTWDQEVLNYHKALIELRNSFTALKDGAMCELYRANSGVKFYAYGRFDGNGAVVTYVNTSGSSAVRSVNASLLGVADGEIMTDWFTGKTYTVSNGSFNAEVPAGGTVLVTGGNRSSYVLGNHMDEINVQEQGSVTAVSDGLVTVTGNNGCIDRQSDSFRFINIPVYQNYSYSAYVKGDSASELVVMARNSLDKDSVYYAVKVKGTAITVLARKTSNAVPVVVTTADMGAAKYIRIERNADNKYVAYLGTESGTTVNYTPLSGAELYLPMDSCNYVGVSVLKGTASYRQEELQKNGRTLYDDFNAPVASSMFHGVDAVKGTVASGRLTLPGNSTVTTKSFDNDWTYKTKLQYTPLQEGDYAGVICKQDERSFVVAGRMRISGEQKLFFAKSSNGKLVVEYLADDVNATSDVVVQLQRIGSAYTAVYSYDEKQWRAIGDSIFFNLSDENPGITVSGTASAAFDYVSFGDAIHDGTSYCAPRTPGKKIDLSGGKYNGTYKLQAVSGTWNMVSEGLYQTQAGVGQMAVTNKVYDSFRAEATFSLEAGASFAGMNFGKADAGTDISDGYLLKYTADGKVILEKAGTEIASYTCDPKDGFLRVVLECQNNNIVVYIGQNATPVMNLHQVSDTFGYFSYCTEGPAHVNNYNVGTINAPVYTAGKAREYDDRIALYAGSSDTQTTTAYLRAYAYTDFMLSTTLSMHGGDDTKTASAGLLLNGFVGASENESVYLRYSSDGTLCLLENGEELCAGYTVPDAPKSIKLMIVKQNGHYAVYVNNGTEPVMQYSEAVNRGGVIGFASVNATALFEELQIDDIGADEDHTGNGIYRNWVQNYVEPKQEFSDDFSSSKLISDDYYAYNGDWTIRDGVIQA